MLDIDKIRALAFAFDQTVEQAHFHKISFRIKKKIFATVDEKTSLVSLKLSAIDQSVFSSLDKTAVYPVPNKWGKQGWTFFDLKKVSIDMFTDALNCAYREVAPKSMADRYKNL